MHPILAGTPCKSVERGILPGTEKFSPNLVAGEEGKPFGSDCVQENKKIWSNPGGRRFAEGGKAQGTRGWDFGNRD